MWRVSIYGVVGIVDDTFFLIFVGGVSLQEKCHSKNIIYLLFPINFSSNRIRALSPQACSRILGQVTNEAVSRRTRSLERNYHEVTGDIICPSMVMGIDHIRDPRLNKGLAFTLEERQALGIHGLQPARFKTQEEQLELCKISIRRYQEDLNKYLYLVDLQVRHLHEFNAFNIVQPLFDPTSSWM